MPSRAGWERINQRFPRLMHHAVGQNEVFCPLPARDALEIWKGPRASAVLPAGMGCCVATSIPSGRLRIKRSFLFASIVRPRLTTGLSPKREAHPVFSRSACTSHRAPSATALSCSPTFHVRRFSQAGTPVAWCTSELYVHGLQPGGLGVRPVHKGCSHETGTPRR